MHITDRPDLKGIETRRASGCLPVYITDRPDLKGIETLHKVFFVLLFLITDRPDLKGIETLSSFLLAIRLAHYR